MKDLYTTDPLAEVPQVAAARTQTAQQALVQKFAQAWETRLAKQAARGGTFTATALTLAACNSDDDDGLTAAEVQQIVQDNTLTSDEVRTIAEETSLTAAEIQAISEGTSLTADEVADIVDESFGTPGDDGVIYLTRLTETITGTSGDDFFFADTPGDFGDGDVIDGGDGFDILDVTVSRETYGSVSNVERLNIQSNEDSSRGGRFFSMDGFDEALQEIHLEHGISDRSAVLQYIQNNPEIHIHRGVRYDNPEFYYDDGAIPTGGEIKIFLHDLVSGTGNPDNTEIIIGDSGDNGPTANVSTLTITNVTEASDLAYRPVAIKSDYDRPTFRPETLNISGDGALTVSSDISLSSWRGEKYTDFLALQNVTTFDFTGNKGGVTFVSLVNEEAFTLDGSSADDTITIGTAAASGTRNISLGEGDDTLILGVVSGDYDSGAGVEFGVVAGDYTIDGGAGSDTVDYSSAGVTAADPGITVDLSNQGTATSDVTAGDTAVGTHDFTNIENLVGTDAQDTLTGGAEANTFEGGDGNDSIDGNGGDDTLVGGAGDDTIDGGAGADTFVFNPSGGGIDTIIDYNVAEDTIRIDGLDGSGNADDDFAANIGTLTFTGGDNSNNTPWDTEIAFDTDDDGTVDGSLILENLFTSGGIQSDLDAIFGSGAAGETSSGSGVWEVDGADVAGSEIQNLLGSTISEDNGDILVAPAPAV